MFDIFEKLKFIFDCGWLDEINVITSQILSKDYKEDLEKCNKNNEG